MPLIDTTQLTWGLASKTKSLKAKHLSSLLVDPRVISRFLVETLEGKEQLNPNSMICIGDASDAWQQSPTKLLAKYDLKDIDSDGWYLFAPKPGNNSNCHEVTDADVINCLQIPKLREKPGQPDFAIIGQYGEKTDYGLMQYGHLGDFILRDPNNPKDCWIVMRKIFLNTYEQLPATQKNT